MAPQPPSAVGSVLGGSQGTAGADGTPGPWKPLTFSLSSEHGAQEPRPQSFLSQEENCMAHGVGDLSPGAPAAASPAAFSHSAPSCADLKLCHVSQVDPAPRAREIGGS